MSDRIYADFTDPLAYLASRRLDRIGTAGRPAPDWRAVSHRHGLPRVTLRLGAEGLAHREAELDRVRGLLHPGEELPGRAPGLLPHPDAPVAAYAEAYCAGHGTEVRRALFEAYWVDGQDIGDPEVLRRLLPPVVARRPYTGDPLHDFGYAVSPARIPLTAAAAHRVRDWQAEWLLLGTPVTFTLTVDDGAHVAVNALQRLALAEGAAAALVPA
jgi:hypothetical protein